MTTTLTYVGAYLLACVGGWFAVAFALCVMRWLVLQKENQPPFSDWAAFLGGATERAVALTLVLEAPPYLPAFIGGWVLLKFAIGWQREKQDEKKQVTEQSFLALIGSVLSFAIAIAIGLSLNPQALQVWAAAR